MQNKKAEGRMRVTTYPEDPWANIMAGNFKGVFTECR